MNAVIVNEEALRELYVEKCLPIHEISKILGVSTGTVFNRMKQYGIATRRHSDVFNFKGKKHSQTVIDTIRRTHKGKRVSNETRQKMSEAKKTGGIGHKKKRGDGYISVYFPDHPKATNDGYIMEHDLVMEALIGRHLADDECVHHKNEIKNDNRKENLELMTKSEHMRLHSTQRWTKRRNDLSIR